MNILHVSLGLPPLRTGGLNRYCIELMEAQAESGDNVSLLFPGRFLPGKVRFRRGDWHGVRTYELINPLPVALTYGVAEPDAFVAPCHEKGMFTLLLEDSAPDVVHVHSYMGLYREFFHAVKAQSIPMVFTTHDYYSMCPRCTLIDSRGRNCVEGEGARACSICCRGGMSLRKSAVMQSRLYARLKSSPLHDKLAGIVKKGMESKGQSLLGDNVEEDRIDGYQCLLDYNREIFELFDIILANSRMTEKIYRKTFPNANYRLAWISHAGLSAKANGDVRDHASHNGPLVVGYFGGRKEYKGYGTLLEASSILHEAGIEFELRLYGDDYGDDVGIKEARTFGRVEHDEMNGILRELDVVVVPSICHETFGFVALEAICTGVSVICSDAVGASELVVPEAMFPAGNANALAEVLRLFSDTGCRRSHLPEDYPISMGEQVRQLKETYRSLIDRMMGGRNV